VPPSRGSAPPCSGAAPGRRRSARPAWNLRTSSTWRGPAPGAAGHLGRPGTWDVPYLGLEDPGEGAVLLAASLREASASRDGEQKDRVGHGFHAVSGFRYGQEVSRTALPARVPGYEPHPALHHQHGGVTGGVMLAELRSFGQGDHRLP